MSYPQTRPSPVVRGIALACLILLLAAPYATGEGDREPATATAYQTAEPIVVDGNLVDWNRSSPLLMDSEAQLVRDADYWLGPQDLSARVYVMWDEEHLYLGADVTEDTPFRAAAMLPFDSQDCFEVYLSTNPDSDPARTSYAATDFRIILLIDSEYWDTAIDRTKVEDSRGFYSAGMAGGQSVLEGFQCAVQRTTLGFTYEAVIPWACFSNAQIPRLVPSVGDAISFDFAITDTEYPCPGTEYVPQMAWTGNSTFASDPSEWGTLVFR